MPNSKQKIKVFVVLCGASYSFRIFGNFYVAEAALLLLLVNGFLSGQSVAISPAVNRFNKALILAIVGEVISDLVRGTDFTSSLKGFSLVLFTLINLNALVLLTKMNKTLINYSLLGYAFSGLISFIIQPSTYARSEVWKFGVGPSITLAVFIFLSKRKFQTWIKATSLLIISFSMLSLLLGARSLALTIFMTGYFVYINRRKNTIRKERSSISFFVALFLSTLVFSSTYSNLAENNFLGQKSQEKYRLQVSGGGNLIVNSRGELLFAGRAIFESPIVGYGSYGVMSSELKTVILNFLEKHGIYLDMASFYRSYGDRIPVHSMILQWWLWFGILGLAFPIKLMKVLIMTLRQKNLPGLYYFIPLSCIWNTIFSPYGETSRILIPLAILFCLESFRDFEKD